MIFLRQVLVLRHLATCHVNCGELLRSFEPEPMMPDPKPLMRHSRWFSRRPFPALPRFSPPFSP